MSISDHGCIVQVGQEHYDVATAVQKILQDYKSLQDIIAILGMDELSEEDKLTVSHLPPSYIPTVADVE